MFLREFLGTCCAMVSKHNKRNKRIGSLRNVERLGGQSVPGSSDDLCVSVHLLVRRSLRFLVGWRCHMNQELRMIGVERLRR